MPTKSSMQTIKDTVYKGVDYALDPTRRKIVFSGTPFNKNDILYEVGVWGLVCQRVPHFCERFPCTKEEFVGAWEDRTVATNEEHTIELAGIFVQIGLLPNTDFLKETMLNFRPIVARS